MEPLLYILIALTIIAIILIVVLRFKPANNNTELIQKLISLDNSLQKIEANLKDDFRINREENAFIAKTNRDEINHTLKDFKQELGQTLRLLIEDAKKDNLTNRETLTKEFNAFKTTFDASVKSFNDLQKEKFAQMEIRQNELVKATETKLDIIKTTVEEKLEKTLGERVTQSFER